MIYKKDVNTCKLCLKGIVLATYNFFNIISIIEP